MTGVVTGEDLNRGRSDVLSLNDMRHRRVGVKFLFQAFKACLSCITGKPCSTNVSKTGLAVKVIGHSI